MQDETPTPQFGIQICGVMLKSSLKHCNALCVYQLSWVKPKERTQNPVVIQFILMIHYANKTQDNVAKWLPAEATF